MLHKMYLVSPKILQRYKHARSKVEAKKRERVKKKKKMRRNLSSQSDSDKCIMLIERLREENVTRNAQLKDIANFMKTVLPQHHSPSHKFETRDRITSTTTVPDKRRRVIVESSLLSTSAAETVYETTSRKPKFETEI